MLIKDLSIIFAAIQDTSGYATLIDGLFGVKLPIGLRLPHHFKDRRQ